MPQVAVQYPEGNIEIAPKLAATYQSGHVTNGTRIRYPHIDGCYMGGPTDTFNPFTVLVMIALSDVPKDFCGNLVVYPGSHKTIGNQFKDNHENLKYLWKQNNNHSIPRGEDRYKHPLDGIQPKQLCIKAGDAVIVHYLLAHSVADNHLCDPTLKLYWRVEHKGHHNKLTEKDDNGNIIGPKFVTDVWSGFNRQFAFSD